MSETAQTVRVAMLGSGIFAKEAHLPAIAEQSQTVQLLANWSRSEDSARDFHKHASNEFNIDTKLYHGEDGLKELLDRNDIDAVIMALPITSQPDMVIKCLAARKHVLSEKPIAETVKRARQLIQEYESTYQKQGLVWEIAEQFYHEPRYKRVKEILDSKSLGKVHFFQQTVFGSMQEGSKYHATSWRTVPDYQGGFLLDGGVHFAAGLAAMLGPIAQVNGTSFLHRKHLAPTDTCYAICKTEGGVDGTLSMSMGSSSTLSRTETLISCEKGHIRLLAAPDSEGGWQLTVHAEGEEPLEERFPSRGVYHEIDSFAKSILTARGRQDLAGSSTARKALRDLAFIEACVNESNKWLDLDAMQ